MLHTEYHARVLTHAGMTHVFTFEHAPCDLQGLMPPRASAFCDRKFFGYVDPYLIQDVDGYRGMRWGIRLSRGDLAGGPTLTAALLNGMDLHVERLEREAARLEQEVQRG